MANSTSVVGVVATTAVGDLPTAMAYDPSNGWMYVADQGSAYMTVLNGTSTEGSVLVGAGCLGVAYDSGTGMVYAANFQTKNVTVVNGTQRVTTIPVGAGPLWPVYDPKDGYVYVLDSDSSSVSIIDGTSLIANVSVGQGPVTAAYDASDGYVYVTSQYSGNETVLSGRAVAGEVPINLALAYDTIYDSYNGMIYVLNTTLQAGRYGAHVGNALGVALRDLTLVDSFHIGTGPQFGAVAAVDVTNGWLYVPDSGTSQVTVLNGSQMVGLVPVGTLPDDALYDPSDGLVYISNQEGYSVSVLNGTSVVYQPSVGIYPEAMTYDSGNSRVYVANLGESTISILGEVRGWEVQFRETGLASGTNWTVTYDGVARSSSTSSILFYAPNGTYTYSVSPILGYSLNNSSATGYSTVTDSGVVIDVVFSVVTSPPPPAHPFPQCLCCCTAGGPPGWPGLSWPRSSAFDAIGAAGSVG